MRVLSAAMCFLVCASLSAPVEAQRAPLFAGLSSTARANVSTTLTLRPEPALIELATRVAAVLELRLGLPVVVGDAPPPVLEAVPAGHVALAERGDVVVLVLGAAGGRSLDTSVALAAEHGDSTVRALALALETLRDDAVELPVRVAPEAPVEAVEAVEVAESSALAVDSGAQSEAQEPARPLSSGLRPLRDEPSAGGEDSDRGFLGQVEPMFYSRLYLGASTASDSFMAGMGAGMGLCVRGYCLYVAADVPANTGGTERLDVRYRYTTFSSGFYARPLSFGPITPGASLGFLTRLGHFDADMGQADGGLDTDLGARGSLELAFEPVQGLDLMTEVGLDFTIDRYQVSSARGVEQRGDRWSPWVQTSVRYRL